MLGGKPSVEAWEEGGGGGSEEIEVIGQGQEGSTVRSQPNSQDVGLVGAEGLREAGEEVPRRPQQHRPGRGLHLQHPPHSSKPYSLGPGPQHDKGGAVGHWQALGERSSQAGHTHT